MEKDLTGQVYISFEEEEIKQLSESVGYPIRTDRDLYDALRDAVEKYVETYHKPYNVLYECDNSNEDEVIGFDTAEEADAYIEEELEKTKLFYIDHSLEYNYMDMGNENGNLTTEIYACGNDWYSRWIRQWQVE